MESAAVSVLMCVSPAESHVGPLLQICRVLAAHGWRVRVLTGARFADRIRAAGAEPVALRAEADVLDELDISQDARGISAMNDGLYRVFFAPADAQFDSLVAALDAEPADVIVSDPTFMGILLLSTRPARPPIAICGIFPLPLSSVDTAPFGFGLPPLPPPLGPIRNRALSWLSRRVVLGRLHRQVDGFLRQHQLAPLGDQFFVDFYVTGGYVEELAQFTVPSFEYPRRDLPADVHFYGPLRGSSRPGWEPPPWWQELEDPRPVVLVTQGTVANFDFGELIGPTLSALAEEDVLVVVTTGGVDGRKLGELATPPGNARVADFVPYAELMAKVDVFVTNGGYGGLQEALAHGVPIVVAGDMQDKLETSARVAWAGVGVNLKTGRPKPAAVRRGVQTVLTNPRYRDAARRIQADIARTDAPRDFLAALERLVAAGPRPGGRLGASRG